MLHFREELSLGFFIQIFPEAATLILFNNVVEIMMVCVLDACIILLATCPARLQGHSRVLQLFFDAAAVGLHIIVILDLLLHLLCRIFSRVMHLNTDLFMQVRLAVTILIVLILAIINFNCDLSSINR